MEIALINARKELTSTVKCVKRYVQKIIWHLKAFAIYSVHCKALINLILLVSRLALLGLRSKERNAFEDKIEESIIFFHFLTIFFISESFSLDTHWMNRKISK
jgi:hypothetical protein